MPIKCFSPGCERKPRVYNFNNKLHGKLRQCDQHARVEYLTMYNQNKSLLEFKEKEVKRLNELEREHINFTSNKTFDPENIPCTQHCFICQIICEDHGDYFDETYGKYFLSKKIGMIRACNNCIKPEFMPMQMRKLCAKNLSYFILGQTCKLQREHIEQQVKDSKKKRPEPPESSELSEQPERSQKARRVSFKAPELIDPVRVEGVGSMPKPSTQSGKKPKKTNKK